MSCAIGMVITAIVMQARCANALLSFYPLRIAGEVSYGLYLWHWPVMTWLNSDRSGLSDPLLKVVQVLLICLLTWLSFVIIETPIRRGKIGRINLSPKIVFPTILVSIATIATIAVVTTWGAPTTPEYLSEEGGVEYQQGSGETTYALIGDSVARSLGPGFQEELNKRNIGYAQATFGGCSVGQLLRVDQNGDPFSNSQRCIEQTRQQFDDLVEKYSPDVIIWYSQRERYAVEVDGRFIAAGTPEWETAVFADWDQTLQRLSSKGARIVLVLPIYGVGGNIKA
jgi:hypothetical protein